MSDITKSIAKMKELEDFSEKNTFVHRMTPHTKIIITLSYIITIVSFGRYQLSNLIIYIIYPAAIILLAEIPYNIIMKRIKIAIPFILFIAIFSLLLDRQTLLTIGNIHLSYGMAAFFSIIIKVILTVSAATILVATTGIRKICYGLRKLKVPSILVILIELIYRYINVLSEETRTVLLAYRLRSSDEKGIRIRDSGRVIGNIILRSINRAERVYQGMCLKGFSGEYMVGKNVRMVNNEKIFMISWIIFFLVARIFNITVVIGNLFV